MDISSRNFLISWLTAGTVPDYLQTELYNCIILTNLLNSLSKSPLYAELKASHCFKKGIICSFISLLLRIS